MCIESTELIRVATRNIVVYKCVLKKYVPDNRWGDFTSHEYSTIFRDFDGYTIYYNHNSPLITLDKLYNSVGFAGGYGFHSFSTVQLAKEYGYGCLILEPKSIAILKGYIPKNSKYQRGKIDKHYYGAGLRAIRSEKIVLVEAIPFNFTQH